MKAEASKQTAFLLHTQKILLVTFLEKNQSKLKTYYFVYYSRT